MASTERPGDKLRATGPRLELVADVGPGVRAKDRRSRVQACDAGPSIAAVSPPRRPRSWTGAPCSIGHSAGGHLSLSLPAGIGMICVMTAAASPPETATNAELIRRAFEILNTHDVAALTQFWTADTVERFPTETSVGADAIGAYFQAAFDALPDFRIASSSDWLRRGMTCSPTGD